jgi:hypothetical protein
MVELFHTLDSETQFMMMLPGERMISIENRSERIKSFNENHVKLIAVAQTDNFTESVATLKKVLDETH